MYSRYEEIELGGPVINAHDVTPGGLTLVYDIGTEFFKTETIEDIIVIDHKKGRLAVLLYGERLNNYVDSQDFFIWGYKAESRKVVYFNLKTKQNMQRIIKLFLMTIWKYKELLRQMKVEIRVV